MPEENSLLKGATVYTFYPLLIALILFLIYLFLYMWQTLFIKLYSYCVKRRNRRAAMEIEIGENEGLPKMSTATKVIQYLGKESMNMLGSDFSFDDRSDEEVSEVESAIKSASPGVSTVLTSYPAYLSRPLQQDQNVPTEGKA